MALRDSPSETPTTSERQQYNKKPTSAKEANRIGCPEGTSPDQPEAKPDALVSSTNGIQIPAETNQESTTVTEPEPKSQFKSLNQGSGSLSNMISSEGAEGSSASVGEHAVKVEPNDSPDITRTPIFIDLTEDNISIESSDSLQESFEEDAGAPRGMAVPEMLKATPKKSEKESNEPFSFRETIQSNDKLVTCNFPTEMMDLDKNKFDGYLDSISKASATPLDTYGLPTLEGGNQFWQFDVQERAEESQDIMVEITRAAKPFRESCPIQPSQKNEGCVQDEHFGIQDPSEFNSEAEDTEATAEFEKLKRKYDKDKMADRVDIADEIEYNRAVQAEEERKRRRARNAGRVASPESEDDSMFFPVGGRSSPSPESEIFDGMLDELMRESNSEPVTDASINKMSRSKTSKSPSTGRIRKSKGKSLQASKKRGQKPRTMDFNSLFQNDLIKIAQQNQAKENQPTFTSKNKQAALSELISSMPEEQRKTHTTDKKELEQATRKFNGIGAMKADGAGGWRLKGMKSSLHHYQLLGVAFMRDLENRKRKPFGGFVSDDMGLGKTVMAIANIIDGRAKPTSRHKATLVVAPSSLLRQWMSEIEKHTEATKDGRVVLYGSQTNIVFNNPVAVLGDMDVVVTSYHEVMNSLPKNDPPPHLVTARAKNEWWIRECEEKKGPLHRVIWRRVIIDEAQAIKNYLSRTSEAVCQLKSKYRWAISGTPIQNRLEEFYAFFRFLDLPHTGSFETFKSNFAKRGSELALGRLRFYLNEFMLRRTHADFIFGRPILKLPDIKSETVKVEFNKIEKTVYRIIQERFVQNIRAFVRAGSVVKKYQTIFVLLLRLRQLTAHILLVQTVFQDLLEESDLQRLWKLTEDEDKPENQQLIQGLKLTLSNATADPTQNPAKAATVGPISFRFRKYLQSLRKDGKWAEIVDKSLCTACREPPTNPHITSCNHIYCFECLNQLNWQAAMEKDQNGVRCLECGIHFDRTEPCSREDLNATSERSNSPCSVRSGIRKTSSANIDNESTDWFTIGGEILQSAKTRATTLQIEKWLQEDAVEKREGTKIIVFTQFRGMIKILERICLEKKWKCVQFHGEMSLEARDKAVRSFSDDPKCFIMLAGLKSGGVGLNLTAANRVIIIDLWWNQSVETQAFCRVYRIGQSREVEVVRFVVEDSVDEDIVAMQERKNKEIDQAVETKHRPGRLSAKELLKLFAIDLERDENGEPIAGAHETPFVMTDDPYHEEEYSGYHSD